MKNIRTVLTCLIVLALIGTITPMISINVSSEVPIYNTQSQPFQFNVTILKDELVNMSVSSLELDSKGEFLYLGTPNGVSIFNLKSKQVQNITINDGLAGPAISDITVDSEGQLLYLGCNAINVEDPYGLSIYNRSSGIITNRRMENGVPPLITKLSFNDVNEKLYLGTDSFGLAIYDTRNDSLITRNYTHGLPSDQIYSLELDINRQILYVGTLAGLAIYNIVNDTFKIRTTAEGLVENHVYNMELDAENQILYLGTWDSRLCIYDIRNDTFTNYETNQWGLSDLTLDPANDILYINSVFWIRVFDAKNHTFISYINESDGLPHHVLSLLWDSTNNNLYVGSDGNGTVICHFSYPFAPTINELPNLDSNGHYIVSWQPSENTTEYTIQESTVPDFSTQIMTFVRVSPSILISDKSNGTYYYRVRASNDYGNSAWSETRCTTIVHLPEAPMLEPIASPDIDGNFTLKWAAIPDAENYTLEESIQSNFTSSTILYHGANTSFNIANKPDGNYYYRIKASNDGGNSSWSTTSARVIHLPGLSTFTISNIVNRSYLITWEIIPNANYYILEEGTSNNFTSPTVRYIGLDTSFFITGEPNRTYYYRIRGWNQAGYGDWSNIQDVYVPPDVIPPTSNDNDWIRWIMVMVGVGIAAIAVTGIIRKRKKAKKMENKIKEEDA